MGMRPSSLLPHPGIRGLSLYLLFPANPEGLSSSMWKERRGPTYRDLTELGYQLSHLSPSLAQLLGLSGQLVLHLV